MHFFGSVGGGGVPVCKKVVEIEKSNVTPRHIADSNSARRVQLIDMSEGGSTNRGCAFLSDGRAGAPLTWGLAAGFAQ